MIAIGQQAVKIFAKSNDAVVRIIVKDQFGRTTSQGSGVVLKEQGWVVTNQHVVRGAYLILAEHEGRYFPLDSIVAVDAQRDIFIMSISASAEDFSWKEIPTLKLVSQDDVAVGQKIYALGSPYGFENTLTEGIISGLRSSAAKQQDFIQISAPISSGSSGGAVLNRKGRLLGISTWIVDARTAQNLNFVVPIWDVIRVGESADGKGNSTKMIELQLLSDAHRSFAHGNYAESISKFKAILSGIDNEDGAMIGQYIANAYHRMGELDSALVHYNKCLSSKRSANAYLGRAAVLLDQSEFDYAMSDYYHVLAKYPEESGLAHLGLGFLYLAMDQKQKCRDHFFEAIRDPRSAPTAYLSLAEMALENGRFEMAIELCKQGLDQHPKEAVLHQKLAAIYRAKGDMQKSMEHQQEASRLLN